MFINKPVRKQEHRQKTDPFYQSKEWKSTRKYVLTRDSHLCQECRKKGKYVQGNTVDHIIPIKSGGSKLGLQNLQTLCESCHASKSATEKR